jgi:hypothetical protein
MFVGVSRELVDHQKIELVGFVATWGIPTAIGFEFSLKLGRAGVVVIINSPHYSRAVDK